MLSFFPRDILDEILNLIESVSEGFPSYSFKPSVNITGRPKAVLSFAVSFVLCSALFIFKCVNLNTSVCLIFSFSKGN